MKTRIVLAALLLIIPVVASAQYFPEGDTATIKLYFKQDGTAFIPSYKDNSILLDRYVESLRLLERPDLMILVTSSASVEGVSTRNAEISIERAASICDYLTEHYNIPASRITSNPIGIDWNNLLHQVSSAQGLSIKEKDDVKNIITGMPELVYDEEGNAIDSRKKRLMDLNGGRTWNWMLAHIFYEQRYAEISVVLPVDTLPTSLVRNEPDIDTVMIVPEPVTPVVVNQPEVVSEPVADVIAQPEPFNSINIKTNVIGLGLLVANIGIEYEKEGKWSVCVPFYFSGWDYFKPTTKFRCLYLQPEFRWYYPNARGLFSAVHIGAGYYDVCFSSGKYRYQDMDGDTPFLNAGVSVGFRHTLSRSGNLMMEYSVGGGYFSTEYDRFYNINNGRMINTDSFNGFTLDHASISFIYRIPL